MLMDETIEIDLRRVQLTVRRIRIHGVNEGVISIIKKMLVSPEMIQYLIFALKTELDQPDTSSTTAPFYFYLGYIAFYCQEMETACKYFDKSIELISEVARTPNLSTTVGSLECYYYYRGNTFFKNEDKISAFKDYLQATKLNSKHIQSYIVMADVFFEVGSYQNALDYTEMVFKLKAENQELFTSDIIVNKIVFFHMFLKIKLEKTALSEIQLNELIIKRPGFYGYYYVRGLVRTNKGLLDLAIADFLAALETTEDSLAIFADIYFSQAEAYLEKASVIADATLKKECLINARDSLRKVLTLKFEDTRALLNLVLIYIKLSQEAFAKKLLEQVLELELDSFNDNYLCGLCCKELKHFSEAEVFFKKAIGLDPTNPSPHLQLGYLYLNEQPAAAKGKFLKVVSLYQALIKNRNFRSNDYKILADTYLELAMLCPQLAEYLEGARVNYKLARWALSENADVSIINQKLEIIENLEKKQEGLLSAQRLNRI